MPNKLDRSLLFWLAALLFGLAAVIASIYLADKPYVVGGLFVTAGLAAVTAIALSSRGMNRRTASHGANAVIMTIVVLGILGVINFIGFRYPKKIDLTANQANTMSDQSEKLIRGLKEPLKFTFFGKAGSREKFKALLDNYRDYSAQVSIEYVDPDKEPARAKAAQISKYDVLQIETRGKISKVDDVTEEKVTNAVIKLLKDQVAAVCFITGHGEGSVSGGSSKDLDMVKKGLEDQSVTVQELNLTQTAKIGDDCGAVALMGPQSSLFPGEVKALESYLLAGGRALFALEASVKGSDLTPELTQMLQGFGAKVGKALIIDPFSKMLGVEAVVPAVQASKDSPISKEFPGGQAIFFPFSKPIEPAAVLPEGLKVTWLAKTTPQAWGESDISALAKGQAKLDKGVDLEGPITVALTVEGIKKGSGSTKEMRLVLLGSSQVASNQFARFGLGLDMVLNSLSWVLEDESMISIRKKEDEATKLELSEQQAQLMKWASIVFLPLFVAIGGIVMWLRRRRM